MDEAALKPRIGLLWRGDRELEPPLSTETVRRLGPLLDAFAQVPVAIEQVVYDDDAIDEIRDVLLSLDVVMVWVNPIHGGHTRVRLDSLLREVAAAGVRVSAHPDTVLKLATKEVLFWARGLHWGSDVHLYRSADEFIEMFPGRLASNQTLVVKRTRGNGGIGVWKVDLVDPRLGDGLVDVRDARSTDGASEEMGLDQFISRCVALFSGSEFLIDQPFQRRLAEGMLRCYFTHDKVVGFARQWPTRGLLDPSEAAVAALVARESVQESADAPAYQAVRYQAEALWLPQLMTLLDLDTYSLPAIWDADLLHGPKTVEGEDTYVLCEINASAVWPFPPTAASTVAAAALALALPSRRR